jgi:N6-adenosine-specific RNA methylase IME4
MTLPLFAEALLWRCALLDPPWPEVGAGEIKRGADRWYPVVGTPGNVVRPMRRVILGSGLWTPDDDAHAWMWSTDNYLPDALGLIDALGFRFVRTFPWVKTSGADALEDLTEEDLRIGIGQYARGAHELLLLAVRGQGQSPDVWTGDRGVRSVIVAPHVLDARGKRVHSAKPPQSYELIERVSKGPRIEFFARSGREGWRAWGNQAPGAAA